MTSGTHGNEGLGLPHDTERLVEGLIDDLAPVKPLPRLRQAYAIVLVAWAAMLGAVLWSQPSPTGTASLLSDGLYLASFVGLIVAALGATLSALAATRPGRPRLESGGLVVSAVALVGAAASCLVGLLGEGALPSPPGADGMCFQRGAFLALLPAGLIVGFLVRGWASHPLRAAFVGLLGAGALGATIVHLGCGFLGPAHLLRGHMLVPLALAGLGVYPVGVLVRRLRG